MSKRNVERIYFPADPQYSRFFVKKYQRRTPLINRIYLLRVHLVDAMICQFLARPSQKSKVVVNLGCGSDPLPWRSLFRHAEDCLSARFVDIDCLEVMAPKCEIVKRTPELIAPLTALEFPENSHVLLRSDQYCQVACDLRHLTEIDKALLQVIDIHGSEILFIAEVSMAHMEVEAADALIHWAGAIGDAEFCLLEHILPDGPSSPFAHAMLQHFAKLNTPVKSVERYPTVNSQRKRFKTLGWPNSRAQSLWGAWSDPLYISPTQRRALDKVEAFDEWEEFVHFASHYCVLHAQTAELWPETFSRESSTAETDLEQFPTTGIDVIFSPTIAPKSVSPRRFGAPLLVQTVLGQQAVVNIFGHGIDGHLRSCDLYCKSADSDAPSQIILPQGGPGARSYFTLTDLGDYGYLLAGGKGSPAAPFNDCWVFKKDANQWIETHSLPVPLFRHAVERLGNSKLVLLAGGRLDSTTVHSGFLVYHPTVGWVRCVIKGTLQPPALSGCLLSCSTALRPNPFAFHGILAGGMTADGIVSNEVLKWVLNVSKPTEPTITFEPTVSRWPAQLLARYGASSARVGDWVVVAGGVAATGTVPTQQGVVRFRAYGEKNETYECLEYTHKLGPKAPRPFFIGTSIVAVDSFEVAIIGGGTPCFSTETGWSHGIYTFDTRASPSCAESVQKRAVWKYSKTPTVTNEASTITRDTSLHHIGLSSTTPIPRIELNSAEHFGSILQSGRPVVFQNLELGRCLAEWSLAYLAEHVGPGRKVVVHESTNQAMDFLSKNFRYKTQTFQEFARDIDDGKKLYLRALSADKPSNSPAKLNVDFPTIAKDFVLPPHLAFVEDKQFSSVLRISGPVNMWLHYDVLANIYCQIQGTKRFYLFPPSDVTQLGFAPGASSSSIDVFSALASSSLPQFCHPHEAIVRPGDVLFLPQLWLHTAAPISTNSVAVNVFFRDLDRGYSSGRDVYGNRDLAAYEKARQDVSRISGAFKDLPRDTKQFYLRRLADELLQHATE